MGVGWQVSVSSSRSPRDVRVCLKRLNNCSSASSAITDDLHVERCLMQSHEHPHFTSLETWTSATLGERRSSRYDDYYMNDLQVQYNLSSNVANSRLEMSVQYQCLNLMFFFFFFVVVPPRVVITILRVFLFLAAESSSQSAPQEGQAGSASRFNLASVVFSSNSVVALSSRSMYCRIVAVSSFVLPSSSSSRAA